MRGLLVAATIAASSSAFAAPFDVAFFQKLQRDERGSDRTISLMAHTTLAAYFAGVADMLNSTRDKATGELYFAGPKKICLPQGVNLTSPIIQALTDSMVHNVEASPDSVRPGWRDTDLSLFIFLALATNYPCPK